MNKPEKLSLFVLAAFVLLLFVIQLQVTIDVFQNSMTAYQIAREREECRNSRQADLVDAGTLDYCLSLGVFR